jgi:hypothetical protein
VRARNDERGAGPRDARAGRGRRAGTSV